MATQKFTTTKTATKNIRRVKVTKTVQKTLPNVSSSQTKFDLLIKQGLVTFSRRKC